MPKSFEEFTTQDIERIRSAVTMLVDFDKLLGSYRTVRIDNNSEWFVLEYKRQSKIVVDGNDYNNPDFSINIKNDFSCVVAGFNEQDEALIRSIVQNYLQANHFDVG